MLHNLSSFQRTITIETVFSRKDILLSYLPFVCNIMFEDSSLNTYSISVGLTQNID